MAIWGSSQSESGQHKAECIVFAMNGRGEIQDANLAAATLTGYTLAELRAMTVDDLLAAGYVPRQANGELLWQNESPQEVLLRHKDGTIIALQWTISTLKLGHQSILMAIAPNVRTLQRSEWALQHLLDQLHLAIETARLGIWRLNVETDHLEWNDQQLAIYGLTRQEFQSNLDGWRIQLHPDDADYANGRLAEVFEGDSVYGVEFRVIRPNGEIRHISASATPIYDDAHTLVELIGINMDVTEIKQKEEELRQRELFLQAIFDNSLNAIMVADDAGNYSSVNQAAAEMFGYPVAQLTQMNVADLRTPDLPGAAERYQRYLNTGREIGEFEFVHPAGGVRVAQYHAVRTAENFNLSILVDVTEQKRDEQELRASEARFRALFTAIPAAIYAWQRVDDDFILVDYNEMALSITNGQIRKLIGGKASELYKNDPQILDELEQCFRQKSIIQREMNYQMRSTGEYGSFNVRYGYVPDNMVLVHTEDVTERRRAEEMLRGHEERLQLVLTGADLGYWDLNLQTWEVSVNERLAAMLGYSLSEVKPHIESWHRLVHPEDEPKVLDLIARHLRGDVPLFEAEYRMLTKEGDWRWVLGRGKVLTWDEYGNPLRAAGTHLDITERKQMEQALIDSEQRFRALMQQSPLPTAIFAPDGTILDGNPALRDLWRLPEDASAVLGSYNALTSRRHIDLGIDEEVKKAFAGESVFIPFYESDAGRSLAEFGVSVDKTETRWLRSHYYPIKDATGKLLNVVLVHEDVTEQKRANDALQAAQERFEKAFFHSPVAMNIINLITGERLEFNDRLVDLTGYSREEIAESTLSTLNMFTDPEQRASAITRLLTAGELYHYPARIRTKQGQIRDLLAYATVLKGFEEGVALLSWIDVTEQNRAQETLRQLSQAIEQSPVSVVITDVEGTIQYVNPKFCQVTGYSFAEAIGQNPRILKSGAHSLDTYRHLWRTISSGQIWQGELQNKKKNGELYWERVSMAGVKDQTGRITHYVSVKEDITEQKRIEEAQARQERLAAVGQMAAGIAHDFNNILGVIVIYAQMLSRSPDLSKRLQERATVIHQQALHASNLVQQILDFSRRSNLEKQPLNLVPLLKEQVKLFQRTLPEHIDLILDCPGDEFTVNADPTRMQQIVTNLVLNARDAMPGGGKLQIGISHVSFAESDPVPVVSMKPGKWLKLSVTDTGTGMSADVLEHIFEPFFTTKERGRGTGLGLPQVYGIVKQHDGHIDVTSHVGVGTTFDLYFPPLLQSDESNSDLDAVFVLPHGVGQCIMVVEDDESLRMVLTDLLTNWNYQVCTAANGLEAQEILAGKQVEVDLILSDVIMPKVGGAAFLAYLQENHPHIPIVFMTGHLSSDEMKKFEALGVKTWLPKPLDIPSLAQVVADLTADRVPVTLFVQHPAGDGPTSAVE